MGVFSNSKKPAEQAKEEQRSEQLQALNSALTGDDVPSAEPDLDLEAGEANAVSSPLDIKFRERNRRLEMLGSSVGEIEGAFSQISSLLLNSEKSANMLAQFIEQSKIDAEADKRIQSENAKLSVANIEKDNTIARQTRQIDQYAGELQVLKERASKYRNALEVARSSILAMRQQRNDDLDGIEQKTNEIAALDARISELVAQNDEYARRYEGQERQIIDLKNELDGQGKRETELRQSLAEANALLENETLRSQNNANELSASQREISQLNLALTSARSEIETLREETEFMKQAHEDERRTFDNRLFGFKTDIDNLGSERRVLRQSLKEAENEIRTLNAEIRDLTAQLRSVTGKLDSLQRSKETERHEASRANTKVAELNLRYNAAISDLNHQRKQREILEQRVETLVAENRKLEEYKIKHDELMIQASEFKSLVADYQKLIAAGRSSFQPMSDADEQMTTEIDQLLGEEDHLDDMTIEEELSLPDNVVSLKDKPTGE
ncbi:MAG: hypothetical protein KI785_00080 [Devosiaceae bacterium]|nr:hypothetical protein [Devosiaceae bacterium MH13]